MLKFGTVQPSKWLNASFFEFGCNLPANSDTLRVVSRTQARFENKPPLAEFEPSLLAGLRTGRPAAFETFVEHFEGPLYRFFVCDHRDYHLAQEQTAETFAQLVRSLPMMRGDVSQLPAFVFAVAVGRLLPLGNEDAVREAPGRASATLSLRPFGVIPYPIGSRETGESLKARFFWAHVWAYPFARFFWLSVVLAGVAAFGGHFVSLRIRLRRNPAR